MSTQIEPHTRPRVEGPREAEILEAALAVLGEVGYDRFNMDAVAQKAKASKATLYRRWNGKVSLVNISSSFSSRSVRGVRTGPAGRPTERSPALTMETAYPFRRLRIPM